MQVVLNERIVIIISWCGIAVKVLCTFENVLYLSNSFENVVTYANPETLSLGMHRTRLVCVGYVS